MFPRYACFSSKGNVAWLEETSSPVRQDYDAVITLAGVWHDPASSFHDRHVHGALLDGFNTAGGLTPDGGLPEWVNRRLDAAADIHKQQGDCSTGGHIHGQCY